MDPGNFTSHVLLLCKLFVKFRWDLCVVVVMATFSTCCCFLRKVLSKGKDCFLKDSDQITDVIKV